jgi:CRP-like cAMP-binding protein
VRALTDGVLLALHREDFNKLLGSLSHIRHMWRFEALRKARGSRSGAVAFAFSVEEDSWLCPCSAAVS